ncbi:MAG: esterase family protein [Vicinamibacteria bacterium]|nr:esterase family protein [Vicinamibacteria bacterium]
MRFDTTSIALIVAALTVPAAGQARLEPDGSAWRITSSVLGETRGVHVSLPPSHAETTRPYPVLLVLDGEAQFANAVAAATALAAAGQVPEMVVVGVPNTNRLRDLTPPGLSVSGSSLREGGDRFLDFFERELLPALGRQFRASGPVVLAGHSSGGVLVTWAAATRPAYGLVLALDTPIHLGDGWLAARLLERARRPDPGRLRYVSQQALHGWSDQRWQALEAARPAAWFVERERLVRESHESMPFLGLYLGLRALFHDYSLLAAPVAPTTRTLAWYHGLEALYGAPLVPPRRLLKRVFEDLVMEGDAQRARSAFDQLVAGYGPAEDSPARRELLAKLDAQPPLTETVEGLLATPPPAAAHAAYLIGEWRGHTWMNPEARSPFLLRLRDEGGKLAGERVTWPEPGVEDVQRLQYLKVVDGGFHFGNLNGMRPRGVVVFEGRLDGDLLAGELRFRGIRFRMDDGSAPPPIHFELRKQR